MKHAYLILAHNEFPILERLVKALDDPRNDIYIHVDRKTSVLPELKTAHAGLSILSDRIDVRWGDVSVVEAEFLLFEWAAKNGGYTYYHLLSGVDMPLKSQDEIHAFCDKQQGKEFIGFSKGDINAQIERKVQRYHLFPRDFRDHKGFFGFSRRLLRYVYLRLQDLFGMKRNQHIEFKKGTQWVSVTHDFVTYILSEKAKVLHTYKNTFCSDEIFIQTLCWHSPFRDSVYDLNNEGNGCMRMIRWKANQIWDWENKDFDILMASDALFVRKFNSRNLEIVDKLLNKVTGS
ncbi:glycosyl transferase [Sphingobacterium alkalisoli]|uniref:Peptide O-xylosyltransferase n=1 Tax=Sphingobacterium alkalisoli TaxID=1874115 RepID=A0A4U0GNH9_9SPHI|nr:beta-1,6-N-acetylglucosaminyltransferase [Sphingobacterium alkalisoli]TJY60136.1 glycosyl transferase [Sphingobacterium alkalisoli]GGH32143.1 glycosyl transferase [Sphingobacterium alkalisoli]